MRGRGVYECHSSKVKGNRSGHLISCVSCVLFAIQCGIHFQEMFPHGRTWGSRAMARRRCTAGTPPVPLALAHAAGGSPGSFGWVYEHRCPLAQGGSGAPREAHPRESVPRVVVSVAAAGDDRRALLGLDQRQKRAVVLRQKLLPHPDGEVVTHPWLPMPARPHEGDRLADHVVGGEDETSRMPAAVALHHLTHPPVLLVVLARVSEEKARVQEDHLARSP